MTGRIHRLPEFANQSLITEDPMELAKLGRNGQVTIPRPVLKRLGLEGEVPLTVETTADGATVLRQAVLVPIGIHSNKRVKEFEENSRMDPMLLVAARRLARARRKQPDRRFRAQQIEAHDLRVFLDANILFRAAYQDRSKLLVFFELAHASVIQLSASAFAIG
jgi:bifunctional DNA-binding transcriptional regulator/antitoxin component of YhaV-PrlF toxin-antitoxin module